ncbi:MAG TPA: VPLPA-CTERM sorting domain-containing protein [Porticoccus sp.]|nr:VPLPA-CTERM sorting domain-containing protein [Porticoccus sp.]
MLGLGSFSDFDAVAAAVTAGELRFGLHLRTIGQAGDSDSYINTSPVPIPAAAWLFGSALIGLVGIRRKN